MERKVHRVQQRPPKPKLLKVAAYARVSSGKDAMLHSLAAQVDYFQNLIRQHPGWEFCGVFADEAKTGTKDERPEYQKMLEKCRNREVDLVKQTGAEIRDNGFTQDVYVAPYKGDRVCAISYHLIRTG